MQEENININELLGVIKRKWKIVVIITAIFFVMSIIISFFIITPKYETTVKLFIGKGTTKHVAVDYDSNEVIMYQKLISTYADVIETNDLIVSALNSANITNLKAEKVLNSLVVTPVTNTQILKISYEDSDKYRTVKVIDAITNQFIHKSKQLIPNSNVQVLEKASLPIKPISPNKTLNILVALILGVVVGIGVVFILEFMDNTFKTKEDLEKVLGVPVLGSINEFSQEIGIVESKRSSRGKK